MHVIRGSALVSSKFSSVSQWNYCVKLDIFKGKQILLNESWSYFDALCYTLLKCALRSFWNLSWHFTLILKQYCHSQPYTGRLMRKHKSRTYVKYVLHIVRIKHKRLRHRKQDMLPMGLHNWMNVNNKVVHEGFNSKCSSTSDNATIGLCYR